MPAERLRITFKGLDPAGVNGDDPGWLTEAVNTIVHRDGVARRRPAVQPRFSTYIHNYPGGAADPSLYPLKSTMTNVIRNGVGGLIRYSDIAFFVRINGSISQSMSSNPMLNPDTLSFDTVSCLLCEADPTSANPTRDGMAIAMSDSSGGGESYPWALQYSGYIGWCMARPDWLKRRSSRIWSAVVHDSSTPTNSGGYRELYLANGESRIAKVRLDTSATGAGNAADGTAGKDSPPDRAVTPFEPSGCDPLMLDAIARSRLIAIYNGLMWFAPRGFGNMLCYSEASFNGPRYNSIHRTKYHFKVSSGAGDDIMALIVMAGGMLVMCKESSYKVTGSPWNDSVRITQVFESGLASQHGFGVVGASSGGVEAKDASTNIVYISNEREICITDGLASEVISDPVQPILDELAEEQIRDVIIRRHGNDGYVWIVWPSADKRRSYGLVYDAIQRRWAGELRFEFLITHMEPHGHGMSIAFKWDASELLAPPESGISAVSAVNTELETDSPFLTGIAETVDGPEADLRMEQMDWAAPGAEVFTFTFYPGSPIVQTLRTGPVGGPMATGRVAWEIEPTGDWNIIAKIYPAAGTVAAESDIAGNEAGSTRNALGEAEAYSDVSYADSAVGTSTGAKRGTFKIFSDETVIADGVALGMVAEMTATGYTAKTWPPLTAMPTGADEFSLSRAVACPSGFSLVSIDIPVGALPPMGPTHT